MKKKVVFFPFAVIFSFAIVIYFSIYGITTHSEVDKRYPAASEDSGRK